MGSRVGSENLGSKEMRIICYQCDKEIGEKAPFSDNRTTHIICEPCLEELLGNLSDKQGPSKGQLRRFDPDATPASEG